MRTAENAMLIHAAAEATRLLEFFGVTSPDEILVEDIAAGLDVDVRVAPLRGAEAHLVRVGDVGSITVSDRLTEPGLQRFAVGHELGHWRMHQDVSQLFFCTDKDLREYRHSGPELEANTFAAELLIPRWMVAGKLLTAEPAWEILDQLKSDFNVAAISAAVRYTELANHPVIAVFSDGRNVRWWRENRARTGGLWLESQQPLSQEAVGFRLVHEHVEPQLEEVPWEAWFPHIERSETPELFELAAPLDDRGTILSLLWVPGW